MSTKLQDISAGDIQVRWRAPFASASLNEKAAVVNPHGIYRGFRLSTSASALSVTVTADKDWDDHVAIVRSLDGYATTVRLTNGDFELDLSTKASTTVAICIFVEYQTNADTFGEIRAYEISPSDEFTVAAELDELVVLGRVSVPGSGVISASSIIPLHRTPSFLREAAEKQDWIPLLSDSGFSIGPESVELASELFYWRTVGSGTPGSENARWFLDGTDSLYGNKSLVLNSATGTYDGRVEQSVWMPLEQGQLIRIRFQFRNQIVPDSGTLAVRLEMVDDTGTFLTNVNALPDTSGIDGSFVETDQIAVAPFAGATDLAYLSRVYVEASSLQYSSSGVAFYLGALQVWAERESSLVDVPPGQQLSVSRFSERLVLGDPQATPFGSATRVLFELDEDSPSGEGSLIIDRTDLDTTSPVPLIDYPGRFDGVGDNLVDTAANAIKPRFQMSVAPGPTEDYTKFWEALQAGDRAARIFAQSDGSVLLTHNADRDGLGNWVKDVGGTRAAALEVSLGGSLKLHLQDTATDTWTTWDFEEAIFGDETLVAIEGRLLPNKNGTVGSETPVISAVGDTGDAVRYYAMEFQQPAGGATDINTSIHSAIGGGDSAGSANADGIELTYNAEWDGGQWVADGSNRSWRFALTDLGLILSYRNTTDPTTHANAAWPADHIFAVDTELNGSDYSSLFKFRDARLQFTNVSTQTVGSNPPASQGITNELRAKNTPKAWGYVSMDGVGGISLDEGFNVASVSITGSGFIGVTFPTGAEMASTAYVVNVTTGNTGFARIYGTANQTTGGFSIRGWTSSGTLKDWNGSPEALDVMFVVYAIQ